MYQGIPALLVSSPSKSTLLNGLKGYWKLDESSGTRNDSTANANNLTDVNSNTAAGTGQINNCGVFVAANGTFLNHADATEFQMGTGDWTLSAWLKFNSNVASTQYTCCYGQPGNVGYAMGVFSGGAFGNISSNAVSTGTFAGNAIANDNNWHLVIAEASGRPSSTLITCYLDNAQADQQSHSDSGTTNNATAGFTLGAKADGGGGFSNKYDGSIDEVGLWNRALTSTERSLLWNSGSGKTYPFS